MGIRSHRACPEKCTVPGCRRDHYAKDLCRMHYERQRLGYGERRRNTTLCVAPGCGGVAECRDRCGKHYARWYRRNRLALAARSDTITSLT